MKKLLIVLLTASLCICAEARRVSGKVACGNEALAGVIVTDGEHFTTTGSNGCFKLEVADKARFVYIVSPSGYQPDFSTGAPQFYQPLTKAKKYEFQLNRAQTGNDFTIFAVSDPQMKHERHLKKFCKAPLEDLIEQSQIHAAKHNTVGIGLGDVAWNELNMFEPYKQEIVKTGIPFYTVIGNHDFIQNMSGRAAQASYEDAFGPVDWAFWLGEDLVVGLNNIRFRGEVKDPTVSGKYTEGYPEWTMVFMRGLLEYIPKGTHIFIAQHSPTFRWFTDKWIVNGKEMLVLLDGYKVDFLSGHTHISNNHIYTENIREHNPAAICGAWWETIWCNDGTPRGYKILDMVDGKLSWYWHNVDYSDDFQVEFLEKGASHYYPECCIANVWDYDDNWTVEWTQDGVAMGTPERVKDVSPTYIDEINKKFGTKEIPKYKRPRKNIHYFAATPSKDASVIVMTVSAPDGRSWTHEFKLKPEE